MGATIYIPDDTWEPYAVAAGGLKEEARELILRTLEENAPEIEDHE